MYVCVCCKRAFVSLSFSSRFGTRKTYYCFVMRKHFEQRKTKEKEEESEHKFSIISCVKNKLSNSREKVSFFGFMSFYCVCVCVLVSVAKKTFIFFK